MEELHYVKLHATLGGGMGGDNWNLDIIKAWAIKENGSQVELLHMQGNPLYRFTGDRKNIEYEFSKIVVN